VIEAPGRARCSSSAMTTLTRCCVSCGSLARTRPVGLVVKTPSPPGPRWMALRRLRRTWILFPGLRRRPGPDGSGHPPHPVLITATGIEAVTMAQLAFVGSPAAPAVELYTVASPRRRRSLLAGALVAGTEGPLVGPAGAWPF